APEASAKGVKIGNLGLKNNHRTRAMALRERAEGSLSWLPILVEFGAGEIQVPGMVIEPPHIQGAVPVRSDPLRIDSQVHGDRTIPCLVEQSSPLLSAESRVGEAAKLGEEHFARRSHYQ